MKKDNRQLKVLMNGLLIGNLEKATQGNLSFTYDQEWLDIPGARPISLSFPLAAKTFTGDVVYNFFDNLLPDNPQIRANIQSKFQAATNHPFDLLAKIGKDCIGAIQIVDSESSEFQRKLHFQVLTEKEIASILRGHQAYPLGMTDDSNDFRISIAGAQEKAAFLKHKNQWCRPLKETPTSHIFKLPIGYIPHQQLDLSDSCENEWLCAQIAKAFGLPIAESSIVYFEDIKVLVVERFDRRLSKDKSWLMRLPQEDMCQAMGVSPNLKYQSDGGPGIIEIMKLLLGSSNPTANRSMFFRSQVLFWLLAAVDGHAKNFSIFIEPAGSYRLTPLYDVISAYPLIAKKQLHEKKIKMAMALKGKNTHYHWHGLQRRHFLETARAAKFSPEIAETIVEEMLQQVESVIDRVAAILPKDFPKKISQPIFSGLLTAKKKLQLP